jgi:hypothetical protein
MTRRTQIYLRDDQYNILNRQASKKKVSIAELIRQAIDRFLPELAVKTKEEDSLNKIIGLGKSGLKDVSEKHDKYLYRKASEE